MKKLIGTVIMSVSLISLGTTMEAIHMDKPGEIKKVKVAYKCEEGQKIVNLALQFKQNGDLKRARAYLNKAKEIEKLNQIKLEIISKKQIESKKEEAQKKEQGNFSGIKKIFFQIHDGFVNLLSYIFPIK